MNPEFIFEVESPETGGIKLLGGESPRFVVMSPQTLQRGDQIQRAQLEDEAVVISVMHSELVSLAANIEAYLYEFYSDDLGKIRPRSGVRLPPYSSV